MAVRLCTSGTPTHYPRQWADGRLAGVVPASFRGKKFLQGIVSDFSQRHGNELNTADASVQLMRVVRSAAAKTPQQIDSAIEAEA